MAHHGFETKRRRFVNLKAVGALLLLSLFVLPVTASGAEREYLLRWYPPADADLAGYRIYVSVESIDPSALPPGSTPIGLQKPDSDGVASYLLGGLDSATDYWLVMTAIDDSDNESLPSNQIQVSAVACDASGCDDGNACTANSCDSGSGACVFDPVPDGTGCDDGQASTVNDACVAGSCQGVTAECFASADCADPDANVCTGTPICRDFRCVEGEPMSCPGSTDPCRTSLCDPVTGCGVVDAPDGTSCNDQDAATSNDQCRSGACSGSYECVNDSDCADSDGDVCTGSARCQDFRCVSTPPLECTGDAVCASPICDPVSGCGFEFHEVGTPCDDGNSKTTNDVCLSAGVCAGEVASDPDPDPDPDSTVGCEDAFGEPSAPRLAWAGDPSTSVAVLWNAPLNPAGAELRFHAKGDPQWFGVQGDVVRSSGCDALYKAELTGLTPETAYRYAVSAAGADGPVWSEVFKAFRTLTPAGETGYVNFVFFASSGLNGAPGSLAAESVKHWLGTVRPRLVLGGGGYAFSSDAIAAGLATDTDDAVETWLEEMSPLFRRAMFLPAFGDTEVEGYSHGERRADYLSRQPVPTAEGAPAGMYSLDAGPAHFVAIDAPDEASMLPATAQGQARLQWLDQDLADARARGLTWIVAYMHLDLYSSELGAPALDEVREALSAVFERHRVDLVLSGDGTSYERSWPILDSVAQVGSSVVKISSTSETIRGVTYVRAGAGGRTTFGEWDGKRPEWSVKRNRRRPHFVWASVLSDSKLLVQVYGVTNDDRIRTLDKFYLQPNVQVADPQEPVNEF